MENPEWRRVGGGCSVFGGVRKVRWYRLLGRFLLKMALFRKNALHEVGSFSALSLQVSGDEVHGVGATAGAGG